MLRIAAAYVLIAASVLAYLVVSRERGVKLEHAAIDEGVTASTRSRYSHQGNVSPVTSAQRRRMLGGSEVEKRLVSIAM
jgi:hypothetical protein